MKFLKIRVLPLFLLFVLSVSLLVVPAFASDFPIEFRDEYAVADWNSKLNTSNTMGLNALAESLKIPASAHDIFWALVDGQVSNKAGEVNRSELEILASSYTAFFTSTIGETFGEQIKNSFGDVFNDMLARTLIGEWDPYFSVEQHPSSGLYRIKEMTTGLFVVDSAGRYPYAESSSDGFLGTDQWVPISAMDGGSFRMLSKEALYNLADDVGGTAYTRGDYICIAKAASSPLVDKMVLANEDGKPYVCWKNKNQSATQQDRPTDKVTENGDIVEGDLIDNSVNLDLEGMTMLLPGGTLAFIDQIIYDESTKSYHIDSHDTYNYEVNNYYTWNYYINYTSITYIGQTEEYNKYYEVYYELPDGRSSADLTKEDLEQLNLSVDVIPYGRSADDTSLRSLYHFDGDTKDSSYWNYCTSFKWNKGASLTYMDSGVFDGALYLDETEHDFTMTLPSNIGSGDFTLQFRYYQSATAAPQTDSFLYLGNEGLIAFNGAQFTMWTPKVDTPIGTWNELAVMRKSGTMCFYLNGVLVHSVASAHVFPNTVRFVFGKEQQTFKYLDEFRFVNEAIYAISGYEPSSVPHDTNLTLVVPTECVPVADEYWKIESSQTNLIPITTESLIGGAKPSVGEWRNPTASGTSSYKLTGFFNTNPEYGSVSYYEGFMTITKTKAYSHDKNSPSSFQSCFYKPNVLYQYKRNEDWSSGYLTGGNYVFSIVTADGEVSSVSFSYPISTYNSNTVVSKTTSWGTFGVHYGTYGGTSLYGTLFIEPNSSVDIVYMELAVGTSTDLTAEKIESVTVMDKSDLNTPTLAVRTDIDIDPSFGDVIYQIGGVRPSIPTKGMVWAMVENERITSLQVYNGQAWEGVDGRIWTGERWVPYSSYNIITLQDLYDIVDATPNYEYIYSEAGFWSWWQKSWNAFTEKLFLTLGSGGTGGVGASGGAGSSELGKVDLDAADLPSDPTEEDGKTLWQFIVLVVNGGKSVVSGTREMFSGVVSTIPDTMDGITGAFDSGGIAVGVFDGSDPDAEDIESEVLDPWRYQ